LRSELFILHLAPLGSFTAAKVNNSGIRVVFIRCYIVDVL